MAGSLPTLIKLQKHKVEKVQKQLNDTKTEITKLDDQLAALEAEVLRGGEIAAQWNDPAMFGQAAAYIKVAKRKAEGMRANRAMLVDIQTQQLAALNEYYAAQKRYETLHQRQEAVAKRAHEAKLQNALDEAAGVGWTAG